MSLSKLKKEFQQMSKEQIIDFVADMYGKVPKAKEYLDLFLNYDLEKLSEKYRKQIKKYVFPTSDYVIRDSEARKVIREVKKLGIDELTLELELYYMECSMEMLDNYGDFGTSYTYDAVEKIFDSADKKITSGNFDDNFSARLETIRNKGSLYGFF